ncbi:MAG: transcription termination factor NusA [Candidatus Wildermuthbacteria bacterium RIFCSPHIGHO2_12_FULL_45_9]|uniref:Transcription termination/antitermination protein NusA n=1 Tax=Candidatus Wildermuthbacteria bacterium RIFCSPHIGHO2_02_FULL_45_25 TaxID=1802450 RepID=A0A1G2R2R0_9BACT|nr:MAG: transcription termination factor NusA [Candidatus Wildermuthbacteria bacterium RIFCSPHIGHO2_01_FULL_45_20]OHA67174.1 MAG: transcription termination factor NusA [Candidatus Wildermuthbacteria bacterium RIFCSPHIGHO2_02_FULL_45_25]OHA71334.1 MAG: transcription termination factor NusA [Candidatus Wildermuthbacteria bacterium RIFCSPHIGHO2_12_FULL_45_9]
MIDFKNFGVLLDSIAEEKGLSKEQVLETLNQALAAAYKKEFGKRGQHIKAQLNTQKGGVDFWQVKLVVTPDQLYTEEELEEMREHREEGEEVSGEEGEEGSKKVRYNPERHLLFQEAQQIKADAQPGDEIEIPLESKTEYGRIAAQTAKQVILQKIREAERETIMKEFASKEETLVSGVVQRMEGRAVFVDLGKTLGILPPEEQVPGEFYRIGQRLRFYVLRVEDSAKGPAILLSRAYPKFISKLFELEVPEIASGTVEIKGITREAGSRSKVGVMSHDDGVDPVGAMVGQRGTRVSAVINELGGEKIDIIEWSDDPQIYVGNALSPAKCLEVELYPRNKAVAIVSEDQLSLAIGKEGQNVRLAAKLTGWKIDVRTPEQKKSAAQGQEEADVHGDSEAQMQEAEQGTRQEDVSTAPGEKS